MFTWTLFHLDLISLCCFFFITVTLAMCLVLLSCYRAHLVSPSTIQNVMRTLQFIINMSTLCLTEVHPISDPDGCAESHVVSCILAVHVCTKFLKRLSRRD